MINSDNKYGVLILAAGQSSRLGQPKQLVQYKNATLLAHTIRECAKVENVDVHVVLGAYAEMFLSEITEDVSVYTNPNWRRGMGNSIAYGVGQIMDHRYEALIISVCDQPYLNSSHIQGLISEYESTPSADIVVSNYDMGSGPPSLFGEAYFISMSELDGDDGAKAIVKQHKDCASYVTFPNGYLDVDREADLSWIKENEEQL